jgi:hypothetical protein
MTMPATKVPGTELWDKYKDLPVDAIPRRIAILEAQMVTLWRLASGCGLAPKQRP